MNNFNQESDMLIKNPSIDINKIVKILKKSAQKTTVDLTPEEEKVFSILNASAQNAPKIIQEINSKRSKANQALIQIPKRPIEVRIVGGWTRDKLINKPSNDIDIMIEDLKGEDFAEIVMEYLKKTVQNPSIIGNSHNIQANPEKTKNIATATADIPLEGFTNPDGTTLTQNIDFAQARSEVYTDPNSRNPIVKPATAEEDAFRRDLTINSINYNIYSGAVEDFTGLGVKDLNNGVNPTIRTPLDPTQTFSDDPLRIFRVIRFATRFGGKIAPEIEKVFKNLDAPLRDKNGKISIDDNKEPLTLRKQLRNKVAKERVKDELMKTFSGPHPENALDILHYSNLWTDIMEDSLSAAIDEENAFLEKNPNKETKNIQRYKDKISPLDMDQSNPHHEMDVWGHTKEVAKNVSEIFKDDPPEERAIAVFGALFHDLGKLYSDIHKPRFDKNKDGETPRMYTDPITNEQKQIISYPGHEQESESISSYIMKYLKFSNSQSKEINGYVKNHMLLHDFTRGKQPSEESYRKLIRTLSEQGVDYKDLYKFTLADAYSKKQGEVEEDTVEQYKALGNKLDKVRETMGDDRYMATPVLNGKEIMDTFSDINGNPKKSGTWMAEVMDFVKTLKDKNPNMAKEEAISLLKKRFVQYLPKPILDGNDILRIFNSPAGAWVAEVKAFVEKLPTPISKDEATNMAMQQFPQYMPQKRDEIVAPVDEDNGIVEASNKTIPRTTCPKHLFNQKVQDVKEAFKQKEYYKVKSIIEELVQKFGHDEGIVRLASKYWLLLLIKDKSLKNYKDLQHIFTKAQSEIFDPILGCFVFGILVLMNTKTKNEAIEDIGNRMVKMKPKLLSAIIKTLPEDVDRPKIKKDFSNKLENN